MEGNTTSTVRRSSFFEESALSQKSSTPKEYKRYYAAPI